MARKKGQNNSERIRYLLSVGLSYSEITVETGIGKSCISFHAKKMGMRRLPWPPGHIGYRRKQATTHCLTCGTLNKPKRRYCSPACRGKRKSDAFIEKWKTGEIKGYGRNGSLSDAIRNYLLSSRGERCEICGWGERNPVTGRVPVVVDHIDGRWENAAEDNLRVICPNCDSLTPTYKALNKGNGHPLRRWRQRNAAKGRVIKIASTDGTGL